MIKDQFVLCWYPCGFSAAAEKSEDFGNRRGSSQIDGQKLFNEGGNMPSIVSVQILPSLVDTRFQARSFLIGIHLKRGVLRKWTMIHSKAHFFWGREKHLGYSISECNFPHQDCCEFPLDSFSILNFTQHTKGTRFQDKESINQRYIMNQCWKFGCFCLFASSL